MNNQTNVNQSQTSLLKQRLQQEKTENKRIGKALWDSEQMIHALFDEALHFMGILTPDGKLLKVNRIALQFAGKTEADCLGKPFWDTHWWSHCTEMQNKLCSAVARASKGELIRLDVTHLAADGSTHYVDFTLRPMKDESGIIIFLIAEGRDVTEHRHADEALFESENKFKRFVERARAGIYLIQDGKFKYVNPRFAEMFGYAAEEFPHNMPFKDLVYAEDIGKVETQVEERLYGDIEPGPYSFRGVKRNGQIFYLEVYGSISTYQGRHAATGTILDVTERKLAQKALRESEALYRLLADNATDVIWTTDMDMQLIYASPSVIKLLGFTVEEMRWRSIYEAFTLDSFEKVRQAFKGETANEEAGNSDLNRSHILELELVHKDGSIIPVEGNFSLLRDRTGKAIGVLGIVRDITKRRKEEEARKKAEEERKKLEERLSRAEKMEALGTLAGGVAHDLNNVLGIVVGFAQMLLLEAEKYSSIRPQLEHIMKGGQRCAAIVDDLLTLARRGVSNRQVFNINKVITDLQQSPELEKLRSYHPAVKIQTDLEPGLLNILGSSVHLYKTLYNLLSNASEAMHNGGILTIKTSNQYLEKPIQGYEEIQEGDYVVLSVSDTGEGIPASDLKRIFEPFYTKKVMGKSGTGLGLAVVWGTVKDHSGYISVQSEEGKGSTFTLYFPVSREEISSESPALAISEYMGHGESILVVDDIEEQRDLASSMLSKLNYKVSSVPSGEQALEYLKNHHVNLIILDMIIEPGIDGLETFKKIIEFKPGQKVIMVSGFAEMEHIKSAQELGAGPFVQKPYIIENLASAIRRHLDVGNI